MYYYLKKAFIKSYTEQKVMAVSFTLHLSHKINFKNSDLRLIIGKVR